MHEKHTLQTGKVVEIRPYGWKEFWDLQRERLSEGKDLEESSKDMGMFDRQIALTDFQQKWRERPLAFCVENWSELQPVLSLSEVREIEGILKRISESEVLAGNSSPAVDAEAAAGLNTANNA